MRTVSYPSTQSGSSLLCLCEAEGTKQTESDTTRALITTYTILGFLIMVIE